MDNIFKEMNVDVNEVFEAPIMKPLTELQLKIKELNIKKKRLVGSRRRYTNIDDLDIIDRAISKIDLELKKIRPIKSKFDALAFANEILDEK